MESPPTPPLRPSRPPPTNPKDLNALLEQINSQSIQTPKSLPDEKCWTRCSQTNLRRAQGLEPKCRSLCYLSMRNQISPILILQSLPKLIPTKEPGTFLFVPGAPLEAVTPTTEKTAQKERVIKPLPLKVVVPPETESAIPAYRWNWLDNRYFYFAKGRKTVINHLEEMGGNSWISIDVIKERCRLVEEKRNELAPRARAEQSRIRKILAVDDEEDYEKLINISELYTNSLQRFHTHLLRIYSPGINNLKKLPATFTDGQAPHETLTSTQGKMVGTIYTKLSDGSALKLGERMIKSTTEVILRLYNGKSSGEGGGGIGGLGGGNGASPM